MSGKELIKNDLSSGNIAHAYLLAGPAGIGKYTAAKEFALKLQCGCEKCAVCNEISRGYHADTIEIVDEGESIKIEQVRGLLEKVNMSKHTRYKILLIENIERMTLESANALLKTLEDPPEGVIFILTTSELREILGTIISRVRLVQFCRDGEIELNEELQQMYDELSGLVAGSDRASQFAYINEIVKMAKESKDKRIVTDFLGVFLVVLRKAMLGTDDADRLKKITNLIKRVQEAKGLLKRNVNSRLLLENLMLNL